MATKIPDPIKIHPFIKFCRYSLLAAGIFYGTTRKKILQITEANKAEEKQRKRIEKAERLLKEKQLAQERDLAQIIAIFTNKPVSDYIGQTTGERILKEQSTQTNGPGEKTNGFGNEERLNDESKKSTCDNRRTENVFEKCDTVVSEIYDKDNKPSCSSPIDKAEIETKQIEECDIYSGKDQNSPNLETTNGQTPQCTDIGEADCTNDEE